MAQNPNVTRDDKNVADLVLTNALIIDYDKIVKADIGIKMVIFLRSVKLETDIMDNVDIIIGATTDIIAAEGKIVTAGGIDTCTSSILNKLKLREWYYNAYRWRNWCF